MSITTYDELKTAVGNWLERSGTAPVTGNVEDWITLAESEINISLQGLRANRVVTTSLTGTVGSPNIDLSSLTDFLNAKSLVLTTGGDHKILRPYVGGMTPRRTSNGVPDAWSLTGGNIVLDAPCDQAHTFEFFYYKKMNVATDYATNYVLQNYPNIYLYKTLHHAAIFFKDIAAAQGYDSKAEVDMAKLLAADAKNSRSVLTVDPALRLHGRFDFYSGDSA